MIKWLLLSLYLPALIAGQFTCPLAASDEPDCLSAEDDDGSHCVWCSLSSFGFCLNEATAEAMEQTLPGVECDRNTDNDDDAAADDVEPVVDDDDAQPTDDAGRTDDTTPATDDQAAADDAIHPGDDALPDDFWNCLGKKSSKDCSAADCTWCVSKVGWGLCMTGPTADSAAASDFFTCDKDVVSELQAELQDPYDASCVEAYLADPTQEGCTGAEDDEGNQCEWCSLAGITNICLTQEQADMGSQLGITCDATTTTSTSSHLRTNTQKEQDPYDPSCMIAFLMDQSQEGCVGAEDSDGRPCEWCSLQGSLNMCLTVEQASMGEAAGITCDGSSWTDMAEEEEVQDDPYDTSCLMAWLEDQSEDGCTSAVDEDGSPCEYCPLAGIGGMCLTESQAEMAEDLGIQCDGANTMIDADVFDRSCIVQANEDGCRAAVDEDGAACRYCQHPGAGHVCLTETQADLVSQIGFWCDDEEKEVMIEDGMEEHEEGEEEETVELPSNFWDCLENYEEGGCRAKSSCTWCNTEAGVGFCMADAVAESVKQCTFFDCEYQDKEPVKAATSYDPTCLAAAALSDAPQDACSESTDSDGNPCVWCSVDGLVGLCLSTEQVAMAGAYVQCNNAVLAQA